jgi:hypothetical protein
MTSTSRTELETPAVTKPGLLTSLNSLARHITANPDLDRIEVYTVSPARDWQSSGRMEIRLHANRPDALAHLTIWSATLTNPTSTAQVIKGSPGSPGHVSGEVEGLLADGAPIRIVSSIPADSLPFSEGRHPLPLPKLTRETVEVTGRG